MKPGELTGRALHRYTTWRDLGMSESAALAEVAASGLIEAADAPVDLFDRRVAKFRALGLSEAAARVAAIGGAGSEVEARRRLTESVPAKPAKTVPARATKSVPKGPGSKPRAMSLETFLEEHGRPVGD